MYCWSAVSSRMTPPVSADELLSGTVYVPQAENDVTNGFAPNAPKPEPVSNAQAKPAAVSGPEGSVAAPVNVTFCPAIVFVGLAVSELIVGATFEMSTVACATSVRPPLSVTCTFTVGIAGPSSAEYVTDWPAVSKLPLSSRSHA